LRDRLLNVIGLMCILLGVAGLGFAFQGFAFGDDPKQILGIGFFIISVILFALLPRRLHAALKDWQSGVIGIIGFTGVCLTIWAQNYSSLLSEERHRVETSENLRAAFTAEAFYLRQDIHIREKLLADSRRKSMPFYLDTTLHNMVLNANAAFLAALSSEEIAALYQMYQVEVSFISSIKSMEFDQKDKSLIRVTLPPTLDQVANGYEFLDKLAGDALVQMMKQHCKIIECSPQEMDDLLHTFGVARTAASGYRDPEPPSPPVQRSR